MDPTGLLLHGVMFATGVAPKPITITNSTPKTLFLAFCFSPDRLKRDWITIGWFPLAAGRSESYPIPVMRVGGKIYTYARTRGGRRCWSGTDTTFGVAVPTYGKLQSDDTFRVYEPKNAGAEIHHSTRASRLSVVNGKLIDVGISGGSMRFVQQA